MFVIAMLIFAYFAREYFKLKNPGGAPQDKGAMSTGAVVTWSISVIIALGSLAATIVGVAKKTSGN